VSGRTGSSAIRCAAVCRSGCSVAAVPAEALTRSNIGAPRDRSAGEPDAAASTTAADGAHGDQLLHLQLVEPQPHAASVEAESSCTARLPLRTAVIICRPEIHAALGGRQ